MNAAVCFRAFVSFVLELITLTFKVTSHRLIPGTSFSFNPASCPCGEHRSSGRQGWPPTHGCLWRSAHRRLLSWPQRTDPPVTWPLRRTWRVGSSEQLHGLLHVPLKELHLSPDRFLPDVSREPQQPAWKHQGVSELWCHLWRFSGVGGREESPQQHFDRHRGIGWWTPKPEGCSSLLYRRSARLEGCVLKREETLLWSVTYTIKCEGVKRPEKFLNSCKV